MPDKPTAAELAGNTPPRPSLPSVICDQCDSDTPMRTEHRIDRNTASGYVAEVDFTCQDCGLKAFGYFDKNGNPVTVDNAHVKRE